MKLLLSNACNTHDYNYIIRIIPVMFNKAQYFSKRRMIFFALFYLYRNMFKYIIYEQLTKTGKQIFKTQEDMKKKENENETTTRPYTDC